jgi:hypothetical protein
VIWVYFMWLVKVIPKTQRCIFIVLVLLISWNVIFIWETGYWTRAIQKIRLIRSLKKSIFRYQDLVEIYSVSAETIINDAIHIAKIYKDKEVNKNVKNIFSSMCDVKLFLTFTSLNLVLLWRLFYLFCSSIVINTVIVTTGTFES